MISVDNRTHLSQTLAQMKHEIGALDQALDGEPAKTAQYSYGVERIDGYILDDYILRFRLGNVIDLSTHLLDACGLNPKETQ